MLRKIKVAAEITLVLACLQEKAKVGMKNSDGQIFVRDRKILRNTLRKAADYLYLDVLQA